MKNENNLILMLPIIGPREAANTKEMVAAERAMAYLSNPCSSRGNEAPFNLLTHLFLRMSCVTLTRAQTKENKLNPTFEMFQATKSGGGPPHFKTLRVRYALGQCASVLECAIGRLLSPSGALLRVRQD